MGFETAAKKMGHFILPYSETIRDRIIFNFEVNNVTHKPKLVAVTGLVRRRRRIDHRGRAGEIVFGNPRA